MNVITRTLVASAIVGASVFGVTAAVAQPHGGPDRGDRMERMLERFDADADGTIDLAEFTTAAVERFERADADGDGLVTEAEREAAREAHRSGMRDRAVERFGEDAVADREARFGADGPRGEGGPHGDRGDRLAEVDRNGDGAIDRVELDEAIADHFARMDATGDGRIDASDREAHRERVRACVHGE